MPVVPFSQQPSFPKAPAASVPPTTLLMVAALMHAEGRLVATKQDSTNGPPPTASDTK